TFQNNLLISPANPQGLSGLNFDQGATGTTAAFSVTGIARASDATTDAFTGTFTSTFTGLNPQQALASMLAGVPVTYSGNITLAPTTTDVLEPFTLSVFGAGVAGALAMRRRKRKA